MSKTNRPPLSLSKLSKFMSGKVRLHPCRKQSHLTTACCRLVAAVHLQLNRFGNASILHACCAAATAQYAAEPSASLQEDKLAVVVATITDDVRLFEVAKLRVVALRFTDTARARITKVGIYPVLSAC